MGLIILMGGFIVFRIWRKHLIIRLLGLEYLVLGFMVLFFSSWVNYMILISLVYLTVTACEGVLGLSVLVGMARTHGRDFFKRFNLDY